MKFTVVRNQGKRPPSAEEPGETVWIGGYQGDGADDQLPASALPNAGSSLEIGTWYRMSEFAQKLQSLHHEESLWTSIKINVQTPQGVLEENIGVIQSSAGCAIFQSVFGLLCRLHKLDDLWIRVE
jgi:hypothetical protein